MMKTWIWQDVTEYVDLAEQQATLLTWHSPAAEEEREESQVMQQRLFIEDAWRRSRR